MMDKDPMEMAFMEVLATPKKQKAKPTSKGRFRYLLLKDVPFREACAR